MTQRIRTMLRRWFPTLYVRCDDCAYLSDPPFDMASLRRHWRADH